MNYPPECQQCPLDRLSDDRVCAVHSQGCKGHGGIHYRPEVQQNEQTKPARTSAGYFWWFDELIAYKPVVQKSQAERQVLLEAHPLFTGKCPCCGHDIDAKTSRAECRHDCPQCGWQEERRQCSEIIDGVVDASPRGEYDPQ